MERALPDPSQLVPWDSWLHPSLLAFQMCRLCMRSLAFVGREGGCVSLPANFFGIHDFQGMVLL